MEGYTTDSTTIITSVGLAILGSGGVVGIMFWFLRRYLEKLLNEKEKEAEKRESFIEQVGSADKVSVQRDGLTYAYAEVAGKSD